MRLCREELLQWHRQAVLLDLKREGCICFKDVCTDGTGIYCRETNISLCALQYPKYVQITAKSLQCNTRHKVIFYIGGGRQIVHSGMADPLFNGVNSTAQTLDAHGTKIVLIERERLHQHSVEREAWTAKAAPDQALR